MEPFIFYKKYNRRSNMYFDYNTIKDLPRDERVKILEEVKVVAEKEQNFVQVHALECMLNAELFLD